MQAELTALHRQHRQHRRMAARSTEDVRAEADAAAAERIAEAAAAHASELATLRAAALQDVQDARAEGEAALATLRAAQTQEAAGWKAERDALRAAARDERRTGGSPADKIARTFERCLGFRPSTADCGAV